MDLYKQFPGFEESPHLAHVYESLEQHGVTTVDVLMHNHSPDYAARLGAQIQCAPHDIESLLVQIAGYAGAGQEEAPQYVSTGIEHVDTALGGGLQRGNVCEVYGASSTGKSQFLLQLCTRTRDSVYIATELPVETRRMRELGSLSHVKCVYCTDFESQDHLLYTQLPALLKTQQCSVVAIDSIGHHLRDADVSVNNATYLREKLAQQEEQLQNVPQYDQLKQQFDEVSHRFFKGTPRFRQKAGRRYYITLLYRHLADLARTHNVAIVVANQVSDFYSEGGAPLSYALQVPRIFGAPREVGARGTTQVPMLGYSWARLVPVRIGFFRTPTRRWIRVNSHVGVENVEVEIGPCGLSVT